MKNEPFKKSIMKFLQPTSPSVSSDVISLQDENPTITMGPHIEDGFDASPPFYIYLNVHDKILHNLTYFGTSTACRRQSTRQSKDRGISAPFWVLLGIWDYVTGMGCRPMGLPMFRPIL
jgi:hypothetical protein